MNGEAPGAGLFEAPSWVGWCCSYCAGPLEVRGHGLFCPAEGRWFATQDGIHRLLPEERRRERAARLGEALARARARLGPGPWGVLEVGAGCCWAGLRLAGAGARVGGGPPGPPAPAPARAAVPDPVRPARWLAPARLI